MYTFLVDAEELGIASKQRCNVDSARVDSTSSLTLALAEELQIAADFTVECFDEDFVSLSPPHAGTYQSTASR